MFTTKFAPVGDSNSSPARPFSTDLASKFTKATPTMAYVSVFRTIAFIAVKSGLFRNHNAFEAEFNANENETRRVLGIESRVRNELRDFFEYKVESEFWYRFRESIHGLSKHDVGPFPGICVPDPRQPRDRSRIHPSLYSAKCLQSNVLRAFLGEDDRYVKALGQKFVGRLFFHADKCADGIYRIWVEPRDGMEVTPLIKEKLEEAYKLLKAYSEVPGEMLPHLEDFLVDYLDGHYVCRNDTSIENEMMGEAEFVIDPERNPDQPADHQAEVGAAVLTFHSTKSTAQSINPRKRAMAISEEEETRDTKRRRKSRYPGSPTPFLYKKCAKLCGAFHMAFQGDSKRPSRPEGLIMPEKEKKEKKKGVGVKKKLKRDRRF
ncbi:hypothetical protein IFR05_006774 [Cadophora sp. M221]|nr:hypothetical protein IFR05_006774 [Cadophora sp. M221]